ncbi:MAG: hypothetical protein ACREMA_03590 [Longimicrobiales bacterium]
MHAGSGFQPSEKPVGKHLTNGRSPFSKEMLWIRPFIRHLLIAAVCGAPGCASAGHSFTATLPEPPQSLADRIGGELKLLGYTATEVADTPAFSRASGVAYSWSVRGERNAGPDFESRGFLYEVLLVTVTRPANSSDSEIVVRAGMESVSFLGIRRRVPSSPPVRRDAEVLLTRLRQNQE